MPTFSQRKGLEPIKKKIQIDKMDDELRNRLWNGLYGEYWSQMSNRDLISEDPKIELLIYRVWHSLLKKAWDDSISYWSNVYIDLKKHFFNCKWNKVYDFIEFVAQNYPDGDDPESNHNEIFTKFCNKVLEQESSGYRLVGNLITPIISEIEINEIEKSLQSPLKPIQEHIKTSLKYLSDRKNPDYRNSIKEAISAVEYICKKIANKPEKTLTSALKRIETEGNIKLHPNLKKAVQELYWYTSDAEGIRHALMDEPNLSAEDAKFMLIVCSAFINYLTEKAGKAGLKL